MSSLLALQSMDSGQSAVVSQASEQRGVGSVGPREKQLRPQSAQSASVMQNSR